MKLEEFWSKSKAPVYDKTGKPLTSDEMLKIASKEVIEFAPYRVGIMVLLED